MESADPGLLGTLAAHWRTYSTGGLALCLVNLARSSKYVLVCDAAPRLSFQPNTLPQTLSIGRCVT